MQMRSLVYSFSLLHNLFKESDMTEQLNWTESVPVGVHHHHVTCVCAHAQLWPQGLWPTKLLCPSESPGKNTRVRLPFPLPRDLPDPGIKPRSPESLALASRFSTISPSPGTFLKCKMLGSSPDPLKQNLHSNQIPRLSVCSLWFAKPALRS